MKINKSIISKVGPLSSSMLSTMLLSQIVILKIFSEILIIKVKIVEEFL